MTKDACEEGVSIVIRWPGLVVVSPSPEEVNELSVQLILLRVSVCVWVGVSSGIFYERVDLFRIREIDGHCHGFLPVFFSVENVHEPVEHDLVFVCLR